MVDYIKTNYGVECNVIFIDKEIDQGGRKRTPIGNLIKVKNFIDYDHKIFRGLKMALDGFLLVRKARKIKNTTVVITSSPPLLPFFAGLFLKKNQKRALWALDLYPEAFKAKGTISEKSFIYKWILKVTYKRKPEFVIALGPEQAKFIAKECYKDESIKTLLLPCGFFEEKPPEIKPSWVEEDKIILGYCGNIDFAHNANFIRYMIDCINPVKHKLVLALYGKKAGELKEYAEGKPGVFLTKSVPRNELSFIDVHMVTLIPEFTHYAVPSKAISAVTMGKSILFAGAEDCDSWQLLKDNGWFINDDSQIESSIKTFMSTITKSEVTEKQNNTDKTIVNLRAMVKDTYDYVAQSK